MTTTEETFPQEPTPARRRAVEANGINVVDESERKGTPAGLFWPWCASNISVLAVAYGAFVLGFGIGLWQALAATLVGAVASFFLVGLVSIAGKRGSAPTLTLSRAPFGKDGNILPCLISYVLLVGWEIVLVALSTLATATVFERLGWAHGDGTKIAAFVVVALVIVLAGHPRVRHDHAPAEGAHDLADRRHPRLHRPHRRPRARPRPARAARR